MKVSIGMVPKICYVIHFWTASLTLAMLGVHGLICNLDFSLEADSIDFILNLSGRLISLKILTQSFLK